MRVHAGGGPLGPLLALCLALALATLEDPEPARVPPRTVAVWPVVIPRVPPGLGRAAERVDSLIGAHLAAAGIPTVPAPEVRAIRARLVDSLGGLVDRRTGELLPARQVALRRAMVRELCGGRGAAWWVEPEVVVVSAPFRGDQVRWHGVSEATGGRAGLSGLLLGTTAGTIPALSLLVTAEDSSGAVRYRGAGGIELLRHVERGTLAAVPADSLLRHRERLARAVALALDSLIALERGASH